MNLRLACEWVREQMLSRVSHRITVRYRTGFDAGMRAVDPDGVIYNLEAIIPDRETGRNSITFLASTGVNEG